MLLSKSNCPFVLLSVGRVLVYCFSWMRSCATGLTNCDLRSTQPPYFFCCDKDHSSHPNHLRCRNLAPSESTLGVILFSSFFINSASRIGIRDISKRWFRAVRPLHSLSYSTPHRNDFLEVSNLTTSRAYACRTLLQPNSLANPCSAAQLAQGRSEDNSSGPQSQPLQIITNLPVVYKPVDASGGHSSLC